MNSRRHLAGVLKAATFTRKTLDPGLQRNEILATLSDGACLHASVLMATLFHQFGIEDAPVSAVVRGGSGEISEGALGTDGRWHGHYWVEARVSHKGLRGVQSPGDEIYVVDLTADQFGYERVVVMTLDDSRAMYRPGAQADVDEVATALATELGCLDRFSSPLQPAQAV